jgi:hypothetical protein
MRSHGPNTHTTAVITNSCHQTGSIPANIEHRELPHVICGGENRPKFHKQSEVAAFHLSVTVFQSTAGFRVSSSKLVQPLPSDDMHFVSQAQEGLVDFDFSFIG